MDTTDAGAEQRPPARTMEIRTRIRRGRVHRAAAVAVLLAATGCATTSAPRGWLPLPQEDTDGYGAWIDLRLRGDATGDRGAVRGELLAAARETVYVATAAGLVSHAWTDVASGDLTWYDSQASQIGAWTALLVVATPSHGAFLLLTLPANLIGGTAMTRHRSRDGHVEYRPGAPIPPRPESTDDGYWPPAARDDTGDVGRRLVRPDGLAMYARFPQGMPPDVDRMRLLMKPLPARRR